MSKDLRVNLVVDQSGSMGNVTDDVIGGLNTLLDAWQEAKGKVLVSLTLFDTSFDVRYTAVDAKEIPNFSKSGPNTYRPNGMTALYDAIGTTLQGVDAWINKRDYAGKVLTVIQTDGGENSSRLFTIGQVNELMDTHKNKGREFSFLGAGQDAWAQGQKFNVVRSNPRANVRYAGGAQSTNAAFSTLATASIGYAAAAAGSAYSSGVSPDQELTD